MTTNINHLKLDGGYIIIDSKTKIYLYTPDGMENTIILKSTFSNILDIINLIPLNKEYDINSIFENNKHMFEVYKNTFNILKYHNSSFIDRNNLIIGYLNDDNTISYDCFGNYVQINSSLNKYIQVNNNNQWRIVFKDITHELETNTVWMDYFYNKQILVELSKIEFELYTGMYTSSQSIILEHNLEDFHKELSNQNYEHKVFKKIFKDYEVNRINDCYMAVVPDKFRLLYFKKDKSFMFGNFETLITFFININKHIYIELDIVINNIIKYFDTLKSYNIIKNLNIYDTVEDVDCFYTYNHTLLIYLTKNKNSYLSIDDNIISFHIGPFIKLYYIDEIESNQVKFDVNDVIDLLKEMNDQYLIVDKEG